MSCGTTIAERVSDVQVYRLRGMTEDGTPIAYGNPDRLFPNGVPVYNRVLVTPHKRKSNLYIALSGVTEAEIRAELRRDIEKVPPSTRANQTIEIKHFSNERGAGWFYQHNDEVCNTWNPLAALAFDLG